MAEEKSKKGILSKLFSPKKNCCCNIKIEEVADSMKDRDPSPPPPSPCCPETRTDPEQK